MVRQLAPRVAAHSPKLHKPPRTHRAAAPVPRTPLAAKSFHAQHARRFAPQQAGPFARRYEKSARPVLPTILEEFEEEEEPPARAARDLRRELDALDVQAGGEDDMDWDEEKTLVALLQDDRSEVSDAEELAALADKLKAPMSAQAQQLKRYMAETIVPAVQRVKTVHEKLDDEVDMAYGTGLLAFNEVCKRVETLALHTEDEIRSEYIDSKKSVDSITSRLTEAYRQRDALWTQLEDDLAACASRARATVEALPGDVETAIARLEKKAKDMEKTANSSGAKHKILKDLLAQF
ncbi:hypothetical protein PsYK624_168650 [Phanerochaete sordida]|uniref:Uncharacterized protein n=1 Tax=Phanerochaete sordida TaxID=48140 RepID=A0A9P3LMH5_9APHY|nr:hypothetical protein PsYK624_168650 [Phanerochaete sordida]